MAHLSAVITLTLLIQDAPAASSSERARAVVIAGIPETHTVIGLEQDLYPTSNDIYFGAIYEIRFLHPNILNKTTDKSVVTRKSIRIVAHAPAWTRPMLFVVESSSEKPVVVWWSWADRRVCIPADLVEQYDLRRSMKRGQVQSDGELCLRT